MPKRSSTASIDFCLTLAIIFAGALGLSSLSLAQAATVLRVAQAGAETFAFAPIDIGATRGFFAKNGVEVQLSTMVSARIPSAMIADSIDVGLMAGTDLSFAGKAPVKGVAALAGPPTAFALVARPDGSVKTPADLKGRLVAVSAVRSLTDWLASQIASSQEWPPGSVRTVGIGDTAARIAALRTSNVDGAVVDIASAVQLQQSGQVKIIVRFGDLVPNFLTHAIIASDRTIAENPQALEGFLRGWFETIAYIRTHKADAVALGARATGVSPAVESLVYDALVRKPFFSDDGRFDAKAMAVLRQAWTEMNALPSGVSPSTLYTEQFLPGLHP
jgi:NitT/TauT family transport system substrate-binding protein